jgi:hypothetical protein
VLALCPPEGVFMPASGFSRSFFLRAVPARTSMMTEFPADLIAAERIEKRQNRQQRKLSFFDAPAFAAIPLARTNP